jgi:hypothetical protein
MLNSTEVRRYFKVPIWTIVKHEVARSIAVRLKEEDPALKPPGSMLGQAFLDAMNSVDPKAGAQVREVIQYLTTRKWGEILDDIREDLSQPMYEVMRSTEGFTWFREFQKFVLNAWNLSCAAPIAPQDTEAPGSSAPPLGEYIMLYCPRCSKIAAKIFSEDYWKLRVAVPEFCVWHPECKGLQDDEILDVLVTVKKEPS